MGWGPGAKRSEEGKGDDSHIFVGETSCCSSRHGKCNAALNWTEWVARETKTWWILAGWVFVSHHHVGSPKQYWQRSQGLSQVVRIPHLKRIDKLRDKDWTAMESWKSWGQCVTAFLRLPRPYFKIYFVRCVMFFLVLPYFPYLSGNGVTYSYRESQIPVVSVSATKTNLKFELLMMLFVMPLLLTLTGYVP